MIIPRHVVRAALWTALCLIFTACTTEHPNTPDTPAPAPDPSACPENRWPPCPAVEDTRPRGFLAGQLVSDFVGEDQYGDAVALRQFRGSTVVLSAGATWCLPCREDAAAYAETRAYLAEAVVDDFWMIEVIDDSRDAPRHVDWAETYGIDEPVIGGRNARHITNILVVSAYPTKIVLDYEGRIVGRQSGSGGWAQIRAWVAEAETRRLAAE